MKTEEGTVFHAVKSFDSVVCSNSKTMKFLDTTKGKDSSKNTVREAVLPCAVV